MVLAGIWHTEMLVGLARFALATLVVFCRRARVAEVADAPDSSCEKGRKERVFAGLIVLTGLTPAAPGPGSTFRRLPARRPRLYTTVTSSSLFGPFSDPR